VKLDADLTGLVATAPVKDGGILPAGLYKATLFSVEDGANFSGEPQWVAHFGDLVSVDGARYPLDLQRLYLDMPDPRVVGRPVPRDIDEAHRKFLSAQFRRLGDLRSFFEAFGYTADSDTDEIIGESCTIEIYHYSPTQGKNIGRTFAKIGKTMPVAAFDEARGDFHPAGPAADDAFAAPAPADANAPTLTDEPPF